MATFSRNVNVGMDWLNEASFEIRGTLDDNVHSVAARLVLSYPDFTIREAVGDITRMPYPGFCQGATVALEGLVGERIGRGFRKRDGEVLGGAASCNHLHTLVTGMAACDAPGRGRPATQTRDGPWLDATAPQLVLRL
jgi:hypothetical protein